MWNAVYTLATSADRIQERLALAAMDLIVLRPEELPVELRDRFEELLNELTKENAIADEGTVAATMRKMSDTQAEKLARDIFDIYTELRGGV